MVENEQEAVDAINTRSIFNNGTNIDPKISRSHPNFHDPWKKATVAFNMDMSYNDVEQNCTAIPGSNSLYEFRTTGTVGELLVRKQPCVCTSCLESNYEECEQNLEWELVQMKADGVRNPTEKHLSQQKGCDFSQMTDDAYEVMDIIGKKIENGDVFYKVTWKGSDEVSWVEESLMDASELIENWEITHGDISDIEEM